VKNLSQFDMAILLEVDKRTIIRWENGESWLKQEKEKFFVEKTKIPIQVVRNLNSHIPISIYYDFSKRIYSLSGLSTKVINAPWYKSGIEADTNRIHFISNDSEIEFVTDIQVMSKNSRPLKPELIKAAAKTLPELNLVLHDQAGLFAGHLTVLPLKHASYLKLKNKEMAEGDLQVDDLNSDLTITPLVFYYYSIYADSIDNTFYIQNRLLAYFREKKYKDYLLAGITYNNREIKIELLREMGLKVLWERPVYEGANERMSFLEGNLDMFLFGKMS